MTYRTVRAELLLVPLLLAIPQALQAQINEQLVRSYLWPQSAAEFAPAEAALRAAPWTTGASRDDMNGLEQIMRAGPPVVPGIGLAVGDTLNQFVVSDSRRPARAGSGAASS